MENLPELERSWAGLPLGARAAIDEQWSALAAGGLPCGSAVLDGSGRLIAAGRNHAYDPAGAIETRIRYPLQHNRLAHAELNVLALIPTETDHTTLTLWTTQHPCLMCAAALQFVGIGKVAFIADDPSDDSPGAVVVARRGRIPYERLASPLWSTICNVLFLYNSAVQQGEEARNLKLNRVRNPELVSLTMELATGDALGRSARSGAALVPALAPALFRAGARCQAPAAQTAQTPMKTIEGDDDEFTRGRNAVPCIALHANRCRGR
jgi:tRNA(Arg) A34 adenosine deaminase TadA